MKPPADRAFRALQNSMLRVASLLVPGPRRSEWRREWQSELWHVRHSVCGCGAFSWPAQREITAFCLGSLKDALCLRQEIPHTREPAPRISGAPAQCVLRLCALLAVSLIASRLLPNVRGESDFTRYHVNPGLILIQTSSSTENFAPTISLALYRDWKGTRQRYFDEFAFYRNVHETASLPSRRLRGWTVTHASLNIFTLLGMDLPVEPATLASDSDLPVVILSDQLWRRDFASDPDVAGSVVRIGNQPARVAGVIPRGAWRLPGEPDAWLLESESSLAAHTSPAAPGYLIAHLSPLGQAFMGRGACVPINMRNAEDDNLDIFGVSFAGRLQDPRETFGFALLLALLALPAVTSVTLGESNYSSHRPSRKRTMIRWVFLAAKFLLVASIAYFASLDLAWWNSSNYSPLAEVGQFAWSFSICLFGFRWALSDQRQRCPVCLRRVSHPAQVGIASRTFLGWNGIEMMCVGGHTLLHVPSLPTSWFGGQRWLYLDSSWEFLFADSGTLCC
jgi:hypothetical protein